jgi:hypothetical protein
MQPSICRSGMAGCESAKNLTAFKNRAPPAQARCGRCRLVPANRSPARAGDSAPFPVSWIGARTSDPEQPLCQVVRRWLPKASRGRSHRPVRRSCSPPGGSRLTPDSGMPKVKEKQNWATTRRNPPCFPLLRRRVSKNEGQARFVYQQSCASCKNHKCYIRGTVENRYDLFAAI